MALRMQLGRDVIRSGAPVSHPRRNLVFAPSLTVAFGSRGGSSYSVRSTHAYAADPTWLYVHVIARLMVHK